MANAIYPKAREAWAQGQVNWGTGTGGDTIKVTLVDLQGGAGYTYSASHEFITSVPSAARIATAILAGKSVTNGVLDSNDSTFSAVTGSQSEALVIWKDTGTEGTSRLLMYIDTATGLPVIPNGGDITVQYPSAGIATL